MVPDLRIRDANGKPIHRDGDYVLYWMMAHRRPFWNHALQRAVEHATALGKPLLILETVRADYPWANERFTAFILDGMQANGQAFAGKPVTYVPWIGAEPGPAPLAAAAARACVVVGDEFPARLPAQLTGAASRMPVRLELVDANGLFPLRASTKACDRAFDFRRLLQRELRPHLGHFPLEDPLKGVVLPRLAALPPGLTAGHPTVDPATLAIDHAIRRAPMQGGWQAADKLLTAFIRRRLGRYAEERSDVESDAASGLSPWLHFGHLSVHQVVASLWAEEGWSPDRLGTSTKGAKEGWWGMSVNAESFLDELVTWRELGYHFCHHRPDFATYESLPAWARKSLDEHAADPRPHLYTPAQLAAAETHDELWNAAQRQLVTEGRMHNYLRMLWGKKVLEWSASPPEALHTLIELNNRYAVDGRDPNSYSGIFWCLGRFDRPWAPIRPIFGCIRYMSSANTARKMRVQSYIDYYAKGQTRIF